MKKLNRYIAIMLIAIVVTTGCSKGDKVSSNEYNRETDYPYMYETNVNGTYITESDDGYYYLDGQWCWCFSRKCGDAKLSFSIAFLI